MAEKSLLFLGTEADRPYLQYLKPYMKDCRVHVYTQPITMLSEVEMYASIANRRITGVISTSLAALSKLTGKDNASLDNYSGSYFKRNGLEYVFIDPLEQVVTVPYGKFLLERFTSKLVKPESWLTAPKFQWRILNESNFQEALQFLSSCDLIACDIETFRHNLAIRCIGYTGIKFTATGCATFSYVIPMDRLWSLDSMRQINRLPAAKIFQNGKYDISYLSRYDAVPTNYLWDTANLMHSWYSELPKDLAFLQSFFVREAAYWKDLAHTNDLEQYYLYNAKDTWATAVAFMAMILEAPEWAKQNYLKEFPLVFPCHLSEMIGLKRNQERLEKARTELEAKIIEREASLNRMLGTQAFNVNSPVQMKKLLRVLGCEDLPNADAKNLAKAAYRHPLNSHILNVITGVPKTDNIDLMGIRSMRKAKSTYLRTDDDADKKGEGGSKDFNGRVLYALNPHGTDSGRLASREHHFWCGINIQNQTTGTLVKQTYESDPGFFYGESDLEQAETRDTAYITGDKNLLLAISSDDDFHSLNASAFFGIPYDEIYDRIKHKTKNKPIRDVAKRVNHGANYNMGAQVLVDTMGEKAIYNAARLLGLGRGLSAKQIAQYLLDRFDKTYPTIRGEYQVWIIAQILTHRKLVGATGWTRYCFSNPKDNKQALNSYVAHAPQSLNAMILNLAYMKVFYDIAIHPDHQNNFKLLAQIHDSILFQYKDGHVYLAGMVKERMEIPVRVTDIKGIVRTLVVPAALKLGKLDGQRVLVPAKYWSETE